MPLVTKAGDIDTAPWCKALQADQIPKCKTREQVSGIRTHLGPQQVAVGVNGGCGSIVIRTKIKAKEAQAKRLRRVLGPKERPQLPLTRGGLASARVKS